MGGFHCSPKFVEYVERFVFRNGKNEKKSLARPKVVIAYGSVVLLAGRVQYVDLHFFSVQLHFLAIGIGLGRLVVLHEFVVHVLQSESRFAYTSAAHHDHFVDGRLLLAVLSVRHLAVYPFFSPSLFFVVLFCLPIYISIPSCLTKSKAILTSSFLFSYLKVNSHFIFLF